MPAPGTCIHGELARKCSQCNQRMQDMKSAFPALFLAPNTDPETMKRPSWMPPISEVDELAADMAACRADNGDLAVMLYETGMRASRAYEELVGELFKVVQHIAKLQDLYFTECNQAEEIVSRCLSVIEKVEKFRNDRAMEE